MTKEVMKKEQNELAETNLFDGCESGFEGTEASSFKTPFLKILNDLSPEVKPESPNYLKEAKQGMYCNGATQELYTELNIVVLKIEHAVIVWKPNREGFVARYPKKQENEVVARQEGLKKWDKEGNEVVDTLEFYCMNMDNPADIFILPLSMSSFKHGLNFNSKLRVLKYNGKLVNVSWAGVWNIKTVVERKGKDSWYTIGGTPEFVRFINTEEKETLILPMKEMLKTAKTDYETDSDSTIEETDEF